MAGRARALPHDHVACPRTLSATLWQTAIHPEQMTSGPRVREPEARAPVTDVRDADSASPHDCVSETSPDEAETRCAVPPRARRISEQDGAWKRRNGVSDAMYKVESLCCGFI